MRIILRIIFVQYIMVLMGNGNFYWSDSKKWRECIGEEEEDAVCLPAVRV